MEAPFFVFKSQQQPRARLFCFPHAGGSPQAFALLRRYLPDAIELCCFSPPGRWRRFRESSLASIADMVDYADKALSGLIALPFGFYGHSLGGIVAFELFKRLMAGGGQRPLFLGIGAVGAPHIQDRPKGLAKLSRDDFLKVVGERFGEIDPRLLEDEELIRTWLPALRADLIALDAYAHPEVASVDGRVIAIYSHGDRAVSADSVRAWQAQTRGTFSCYGVEGDHLFLQKSARVVATILGDELSPGE